jgi:hypothetical protein
VLKVGTRVSGPSISGPTIALLLAGLVSAATLESLASFGFGGPTLSAALPLAGEGMMELWAAAVIFLASYRMRRDSEAMLWGALGVACLATGVADLVYAYQKIVLGSLPIGVSVTDVLYAVQYPAITAVAVARALRADRGVDLTWSVVEAGVAATVIGFATWYGVVAPRLGTIDQPGLASVQDAAYVILDIPFAVLPMLVLMSVLVRSSDRATMAPWAFAAAGVMTWFAADMGWFVQSASGTWAPGSLVDFGYMAGAVLLAAGAWLASDADARRRAARRAAMLRPGNGRRAVPAKRAA